MIVRMSTENFQWLCFIVTEIFTFKKLEVKNIVFMFVEFLYSRQFRHIRYMDRSLNWHFMNT